MCGVLSEGIFGKYSKIKILVKIFFENFDYGSGKSAMDERVNKVFPQK